ncbi:MAG: FAD:protein FMN transferase [Oscillospiraceae bacterium]
MKRIAALFLCLLVFCGCSARETRTDFFAMNTFMQITAYGDAPADEAKAMIISLEKALSVTYADSDISRINSSNGEAVAVSAETAELIQAAIKLCERTDGALDITIYPVVREWGFTTDNYRIPDQETLSELSEYVDYRKVKTDGGSVSLPEGFMLDLGAVAKGCAADKTLALFKQNGVKSALINLGGNVYALGSKPDGSAWKIGIADPLKPEEICGRISVCDKAAVTSGDYERFFIGEDGKKYCHIIDPSDCRPADNGLCSVTIIADSGLLCDALSTAMFVMGKQAALEHWRTYRDFEMVLIEADGSITVTEGLEGVFEPVGERSYEVAR